MAEYWNFGISNPSATAAAAKRLEDEGWDGLVFVDSQNLRMDCFVAMTLAAAATSKIKLSPGVTNPVTRHPAVAAGAIAALHAASGGRASYGIGRGDSALAYIGMAPCSLRYFENYVKNIQAYLRGEEIPFADLDFGDKNLDKLNLKDQPGGSSLKWLDPNLPKVPVEVVGTGPKAIGIGGRHADIVTFTVGADSERLHWAISTARDACLNPTGLKLGAYVNIACHPDITTARKVISGGLASFSRFASMHGPATGPLDASSEKVLKDIHANYDMTRHGDVKGGQASVMSDDFIDRFAVVGDVEQCAAKIRAIQDMGIDRIVFTPPNEMAVNAYPEETSVANDFLVNELLPVLKST